jgi:hypothetical protein
MKKIEFADNKSGSSVGRIRKILSYGAMLIFLLLLSQCTVYTQGSQARVNVTPPPWAPAYDNVGMVRYYYFPDIECYYDVWNQEFVYLEDGSWMFGSVLPPSYGWFDLNTAFIVLLDYNVFEPWHHFNYYVSHYPRYYYRSVYRGRYEDAEHPIRGFNEHSRTTLEKSGRESTQIRTQTEVNQNVNRSNTEKEVKVRQNYPERRVTETRPAQRMEYKGKEIGRPVRVYHSSGRSYGNRRK